LSDMRGVGSELGPSKETGAVGGKRTGRRERDEGGREGRRTREVSFEVLFLPSPPSHQNEQGKKDRCTYKELLARESAMAMVYTSPRGVEEGRGEEREGEKGGRTSTLFFEGRAARERLEAGAFEGRGGRCRRS